MWILIVWCFALFVPLLSAAVEVYPGPGQNAYKSNQYSVQIYQNGQWVDSYTYMYSRKSVCNNYFQNQNPTVSWTTFGLSEEVLVRVEKISGSVTNALVLPLSYGNDNWHDSRYVYFYIKPNQKIGVKINNSLYHTIHIFANPPKPPVPSGARYFGAGVHDVGLDYDVSFLTAIYIDGGAWVKGTLNLKNASNFKILGPGVLSGEKWRWEDIAALPWAEVSRYMLIHSSDSSGTVTKNTPIQISGPTLVASPSYNFYLMNRKALTIDNVHLISPWTWNTDGFGVSANPADITHSFCFVNDNAIFPEFIWAGNSNITDSVINGRAVFNVGYGYFAGLKTWGSSQNIDIIYPEFVSLVPGDLTYHSAVFDAKIDGTSSDITVENQIHENITMPGNIDKLVNFTIEDTDWGSPAPALGNIRNIHFKNIDVQGTQRFKSVILGKDGSNRISNITFTNLKINGTYVDASNFQNYFDIGPFADTVLFYVTPQGDINEDCVVNIEDVWILAEHWLQPNLCGISKGDITGDCKINLEDFSVLAENWLEDNR